VIDCKQKKSNRSSNTRRNLPSRQAIRQNNSVDLQKNAYLFWHSFADYEKIWHFSTKAVQLNENSINLVAA
jgi:hypothetical protein